MHVSAVEEVGRERSRRLSHQRQMRHVLTVAILVLNAEAGAAVVVNDLALEDAMPCAGVISTVNRGRPQLVVLPCS